MPEANVSGDDPIRLFLALRVAEEVLDEIEQWQRDQLPNIRLVSRENLHITLAFLGNRPSGERRSIVGALRAAAAEAGAIRLTPVRYRETRSVGMLLLDDENANAAALAGDVQARLEELGVYRRDGRPWLPHLTVARWRERPRLRPGPPPCRTFVPSDATAYLSRLRSGGAQYEVLESVALGG